jgi:phosphoenolpyruvate carboxylase
MLCFILIILLYYLTLRVEDAVFSIVNNMEGRGSVDIKEKQKLKVKKIELIEFFENFNVRTVLTAHPTSFTRLSTWYHKRFDRCYSSKHY